MNKLWFLFYVGLIGCSSIPLSTSNEAARQYYLAGRSFEKQSDQAKALDAYKSASRADEAFWEAYAALGRMYEKAGNFRKASFFYEKALSLKDTVFLYLPYARVMMLLERYDEAFLFSRKYNRMYPNDSDGLSILADAAQALRDPGAEADLQKWTQIDSSDINAWVHLAQYYFDQKDFGLAIPIYERISSRGVKLDGDFYFEWAQCFLYLKIWDEAKAKLTTAIAMGVKHQQANDYLQLTEEILFGRFKETVFSGYLNSKQELELIDQAPDRQAAFASITSRVEESLQKEPSFYLGHKLLADLYFTAGYDSLAKPHLDWLIQNNRGDAQDRADRAYLFFRAGDFENAKREYQVSLGIAPNQPAVKRYLEIIEKIATGKINKKAYSFFELAATKPDSSEWYYHKAIQTDSNYAESYIQLGLVYYQQRDYVKAESAFRNGLIKSSDMTLIPKFQYNLGLVYSKLDYHDKAIAEFKKVLSADSTDADALYYLSLTYADKSDLRDATEYHDRVIREAPDYFLPSTDELRQVGITTDPALGAQTLRFDDSLAIGRTNTYRLKIKSKKNALIGADVNGDLSREMTIVFREQVLDVTNFGVSEFSLEILSVVGYALTPKEKNLTGQKFYLRISSVFGVVNIYGLMEENPNSLQRFVIAVMEDLHGHFYRNTVREGEMWRSSQNVFKLGGVSSVTELDDISNGMAGLKKTYAIFGSYDAAKYGESGRVTLQNAGRAEFEMDLKARRISRFHNRFTTKEFRESTATLEVQEAEYDVRLTDSRIERLEEPKKVTLDLPYVRQHGPQCAAAALSMVLSYYKVQLDQDEIYAKIKSDFAGAQSGDILNFPRSLGKFKSFGYAGTLDDLKRRVDQGQPMLVFLSPFGFGHVVVVVGYDETKHQIIMHDPTVADYQAVSYDDFLQEWQQSGNECVLVVPFDKTLTLGEAPISSYTAVETKWRADKEASDRQYDKALLLYRESLKAFPGFQGAMEGIMLLHLQRDEFDKASLILDTLLTANPNSTELILKRASILLSQYDYDKVLQITRRAKQLDESNITNYILGANALYSQKKYEEAAAEIRQAIKINPLISSPRNLYAGILAEMGDFDNAYGQSELAIKYEPENVGNYLSLVGIYQTEISNKFRTGPKKLELIKKSLAQLDKIKEISPALPNIDQLYADVFILSGDFAQGDSLFRQNIKKFPEENGAYNNFAWRLATAGERLTEAEKLSQKSIELSQRNPYYFDTMGWIHFKMAVNFQSSGRNDSAEVYFQKAEAELKSTIAYDRYSDFAFRHLGVMYEKWNKPDLAAKAFMDAGEFLADRVRVNTEIAQDCEEAGIYDRAMEYYRKAIDEKLNFEYGNYRMAWIYSVVKEDYKTSEVYLSRAIEQDSSNYLYQGLRGINAYLKKDYSAAISILKNQAYADQESIVQYYYLGLAYRAMGNIAESKKIMMEYLRREPNGRFSSEARKIAR